jgi:predicted NAD/FAD-dependent oxidoreductase
MNALAQSLAQDLSVRLNTHLVAVAPLADRWQAQDQKGHTLTADALILTPPAPIALALLQAETVPLHADDYTVLKRIAYAPCLAGLFWLSAEAQLPEPGAVQRPNAALTWIADNQRKGISPDASLITVHAGADYSRLLWDLPDWEALLALENGLQLFKDHRTQIVERHLDRWQYSIPTMIHNEPALRVRDLPPLVFAGDGFGSARVEGAALSGLAAAEAIVW